MYYTLAKEEHGCASPIRIYLRLDLEGVAPPSILLEHNISVASCPHLSAAPSMLHGRAVVQVTANVCTRKWAWGGSVALTLRGTQQAPTG